MLSGQGRAGERRDCEAEGYRVSVHMATGEVTLGCELSPALEAELTEIPGGTELSLRRTVPRRPLRLAP